MKQNSTLTKLWDKSETRVHVQQCKSERKKQVGAAWSAVTKMRAKEKELQEKIKLSCLRTDAQSVFVNAAQMM